MGNDLVAWDVAERVARQITARRPPLDGATRRSLEHDFAEATARAEHLVEEATGLRSTAGPTHGVVTDRAGWVAVNISSFQRLLVPVAKRIASGSVPLRRAFGAGNRAAAGVEVGLLLGWMSGRVLGQYDFPLQLDSDEGDVVYYVGENIVSLEQRHGFAPAEFRLWIALHEVTHRMQFTGVPWMRAHFLGLVERGLELSPPNVSSLLESLRRAAAEIRSGRNPLAEGGVVGLFATSDQLATLREVQALMSLLEGHGDVVMGRAAREEIPGAEQFASTLHERRTSASGLSRLALQVVGIEAKLRQYAEGEHFVEALLAAGGDELVASVWRSPAMLPSIEEIREPQRYLDRAGAVARSGA